MLVPAFVNGGSEPLLGPAVTGSAGDVLFNAGNGLLSWQTFTPLVQSTLGTSLVSPEGILVAFDGQTGLTSLSLTSEVAKTNVANAFTKAQWTTPVTLTDAATIAWDFSLSNVFEVTPTGARDMGAPTNVQDGQTVILRIKGSGSIGNWNATFDFGTDGPPTLTSTAGKYDTLTFVGRGGSKTVEFCGIRKGQTI